MICGICPHHCNLKENQTGLCRARTNIGGKIVCANYGIVTSISLDPIEKKPLAQFHPGSMILSFGSYGCNLNCGFCQNSDISMSDGTEETVYVSPEALVDKAKELIPRGNIGLAFTYNEPVISFEFVRDCCALAHENGLKTVLVTNGMICAGPLKELLPHIDAMNIDLKGFSQRFYDMVNGDFQTVKDTIETASKRCHVEVTTLIIPGLNDSKAEMEEEAKWLSSLGEDIPLHISRFFPRYKMLDREATPIQTIYALRDVARGYLKYVYTGNC